MKSKTLFRFGFVFLVLLLACIPKTNAQAQSSKMNWGIRLGLNATSITSYEVYQADEILTNTSYTNKTGYLINAFARFNMDRMFLQPELGWNHYRRTCSFSLPVEETASYYPAVDLNINSKALNANFLVGYNIVSNYPFLFGVFAGPAFTGTYRTNYVMGQEKTFPETDLFINLSGILGFSINISKIYFDLRHEMCLPNTNLHLKDIPDFPESYQNIKIKKTESFLSFSFGIMF